MQLLRIRGDAIDRGLLGRMRLKATLPLVVQMLGLPLFATSIVAEFEKSKPFPTTPIGSNSEPWIENPRSFAAAEAISDSVERSADGWSLKGVGR